MSIVIVSVRMEESISNPDVNHSATLAPPGFVQGWRANITSMGNSAL